MLSTRREKILGAIVEQYIATGEPVGSKTLLSKLSISVSSATIRNDMAALTKLDLIYQPHTSAGRIPTEKGYRYYVDNLMKPEELGEGDRRRIEAGVDTRSGDPEILLEKVGEALGELTNFAAMATTPADENASIRNIRMAPVSSRTCVVVLLTSTGILKSKACRMDTEITDDIIQSFRDIVGREFIGKPLKEITTIFIQTLVASLGVQAFTMMPLLTTVGDLVESASQATITVEGQSRLLGYKDYEGNVTELLNFLHEQGPLEMLLSDAPSGEGDITVRIGTENRFHELQNSTTIISKYRIGDGASGAIGIIGPTRMDYSKLIPSIKYLSDVVSRVLSEVYEEDSSNDGYRE
ncbi:MAG: heat-inducible transcriptional repressor HrcA [Acutalibacteraceae bacterium]|nr:heat-inducible transcriptional repressor HrcA [Acutalibacteraceae bacterium]